MAHVQENVSDARPWCQLYFEAACPLRACRYRRKRGRV